MSEPRMRRCAAALLLLAAGATGAPAQDLRAIEDSLVAARERVADARTQLAAAEFRVRAIPNDSVIAAGATVLFNTADVPVAERRRLARAFAHVEAELRQDLGDAGATLLAETRWQLIVSQRPGMFERPYVTLVPLIQRSASPSAVIRFPLVQTVVTRIVKNGVGDRLLARHPALNGWLGGSLYLREPSETYYAASRELAVRGNGRSRRCARGDIAECAIILDPAREAEWHLGEPDAPGLAPASHGVRESVFHFAMERAGAALLPALDAAADSAEPIALLAQAAGLSRDELLGQWQAAISGGGTARARVAPRLALTSLAWIVLFGVVATRRRPR